MTFTERVDASAGRAATDAAGSGAGLRAKDGIVGLAACAAGRETGARGGALRAAGVVRVAAGVGRTAVGAGAASDGRAPGVGLAAGAGAIGAVGGAGGGSTFAVEGRTGASVLSGRLATGVGAVVVIGGGDAGRANGGPLDTGAVAPAAGPRAGALTGGLAGGGGTVDFGRASADTAGVAGATCGGSGAADMADGDVIGRAGGAATGCGRPGSVAVGRGDGTGLRIGAVDGRSMGVVVPAGGPGTVGGVACATDTGAATGRPVIGVPSGACDSDNATCGGDGGVGIAASDGVACESRADVASAGDAATALRGRRGVAGLPSATVFAFAGARVDRGVTSTVAITSFLGLPRRRAGMAGGEASAGTAASIAAARGLRLRGGFEGASSSMPRV